LSDQVISPPAGAGPPGTSPSGSRAGRPGPDPRWLLFTGGPRLGWSFRDRRELVPAYPEPQPGPQAIHAASAARTTVADARLARAWKWAGKPSIGLALIIVLLAACARTTGDSDFSPLLALITGVIVCAPGLAYTGSARADMLRFRLNPGRAFERYAELLFYPEGDFNLTIHQRYQPYEDLVFVLSSEFPRVGAAETLWRSVNQADLLLPAPYWREAYHLQKPLWTAQVDVREPRGIEVLQALAVSVHGSGVWGT